MASGASTSTGRPAGVPRRRVQGSSGAGVARAVSSLAAENGDDPDAPGGWWDTVDSLLWVGAAVVVGYYADIVNVLRTSDAIWWPALGVSALMLLALVGVAAMLTYGMPLLGKPTLPTTEWGTAYPRVFPVLLGALGVAAVAVPVGLWPHYSYWSLLISFFLGMGAFMAFTLLASL